jgi:trimeric autotransporter adhesin
MLALLLLECEQADALLTGSVYSKIHAVRHARHSASAAAAGREDVAVTAEPAIPRRESMTTIVEELNRLRAQEHHAGSAASTIDSTIAAFLDAPADIPLPSMSKTQSAEPAAAAAATAVAAPSLDDSAATAITAAATVQPTEAADLIDSTTSAASSSSSSSNADSEAESSSTAAPSPSAAAAAVAADTVPAPFAHQPWLTGHDRVRARKGPNVAHARAQRLIVLELKQLR